MPLPKNWVTIYRFLTSNGYTPIAAAGILGNIEQESHGDPEARSPDGGGGLIQWTPTPAGYVTGNASRDLQTQLHGILRYNNAQGQLAVARLNKSQTPQQAAIYYMQAFERPAAATANQANRVASAVLVHQHAGGGGVGAGDLIGGFLGGAVAPASVGSGPGGSPSLPNVGSIGSELVSAAESALGIPTDWLPRAGKFLLAGLLGIGGVWFIMEKEGWHPVKSMESVGTKAATVATIAA